MQSRLFLWFLAMVFGLCSVAQAQSSIATFVSLTGGPTPNPAVVGQTVSMTWKASISGGNSTQTECLVNNASWTWSVDSYTFTPTGGTTPTTLDFTTGPNRVSLTSNGDSARTSVVPPSGGGTYNLTVRAKYTCNTSACGPLGTIPDATNSVQFQVTPVGSFVLHPNSADFQSGSQGRVLISKQRGDSFYTINNTTRSNTPAQSGTGNHQVTVTAQMPATQAGTTVYFRVSDPADASPYHTGTSGNDNGWAGGSAGTPAGIQSATASAVTINGSQLAAAEITLDIGTEGGNNFDVEASLVPFSTAQPSDIQKTPRLVAWKRGYIEQDDSYTTGSPIQKHFQQQAASGNDILHVYSVTDTPAGTDVLISLSSPVVYNGISYNSINRRVVRVDPSANDIEVSPIPFHLPIYSGITPLGSPIVHASTASLVTGFGGSTAGSDSGAFVEFVVGIQGSRIMPNYPAENPEGIEDFLDSYWFSNSGGRNVFQLITRAFQVDPRPGEQFTGGQTGGNSSRVYTSKTNSPLWQSIVQRNVVHETGHNFALDSGTNGHVDMYVDAPAVSPPGVNCIMSYNNNPTTGYVKFDSLCYKTIRGCPDPR